MSSRRRLPAPTRRSCLGEHTDGAPLHTGCDYLLPAYAPAAVPVTQIAGDIVVRRTFGPFHLYDIDLDSDGIVPQPSNQGYLDMKRKGDWPKHASVSSTTDKCTINSDTLATAAEAADWTKSALADRGRRIRADAQTTAGCNQTASTVSVSGGAYTLTVEPQTQTVYVANIDSDTVSIINARTCNARITSGCNQTPVTVRTGASPAGLQLDPSTHTLYVANRGDHTVSLIDTTSCNATTSVGCATSRPTVPIMAAPRFMAISPSTATLYVSTKDDSSLAMIDTTRCNAHTTIGCHITPRVAHVGYLPYQVAIDHRSGDILVGNVGDSTISIIDGTACNAKTTIGCQQHTATIETGGWPTNLTIDARTTTVYVSDNVDATVSIINIEPLRS